jgi:HlyD family secretion protein
MLWSQLAIADELEATLEWSHLHVVGFEVDGGVVAVHARAGDRVSKGGKLIELDPKPAEIRVRQFRAELASLKPALADSRREYEHAQSLYEQTVLSDVELDKTRLAFEKAQADIDRAQAQLDMARWKLDNKTAYAPWDGIVLERNIEVGDMLVDEQRSRRWMTLASTNMIAARTTVPAATAAAIRTGDKVRVAAGGKTYDATIIEIEHRPEQDMQNFSLLAEFEITPADRVVAGMSARVTLDR